MWTNFLCCVVLKLKRWKDQRILLGFLKFREHKESKEKIDTLRSEKKMPKERKMLRNEKEEGIKR